MSPEQNRFRNINIFFNDMIRNYIIRNQPSVRIHSFQELYSVFKSRGQRSNHGNLTYNRQNIARVDMEYFITPNFCIGHFQSARSHLQWVDIGVRNGVDRNGDSAPISVLYPYYIDDINRRIFCIHEMNRSTDLVIVFHERVSQGYITLDVEAYYTKKLYRIRRNIHTEYRYGRRVTRNPKFIGIVGLNWLMLLQYVFVIKNSFF